MTIAAQSQPTANAGRYRWLIDRFGPKIGYAIAIGIWTAGRMAHGLASSITSFMAARALLGLGWRETFLYSGGVGISLLLLWLWLYSNARESGRVSEGELAWIEHDPVDQVERIGWARVVSAKEAWAFAIAKFLTDPVWFPMLFWLPKYFASTYDVDLKIVLLPMIAMYLLSDVGSIAGGWLSSKLIQRGRCPNFARKTTMLIAGCCVLPLLFVSGLENMWLAVVLIGIALTGHQAF